MRNVGSTIYAAQMFPRQGSAADTTSPRSAETVVPARRIHDARRLIQHRREAQEVCAEFLAALTDPLTPPRELLEVALKARRAADLVWGAAARLVE